MLSIMYSRSGDGRGKLPVLCQRSDYSTNRWDLVGLCRVA